MRFETFRTGRLSLVLLLAAVLCASSSLSGTQRSLSRAQLARIHGKIQFVNSFPDYKVKVVGSFADLHVKMVDHFPDKPGLWKKVDRFPDFKIQLVDSFPDFTIRYVESFPGVR